MISPIDREIGRDIGIALLAIERVVWWFIHHEEMIEKLAVKFGRRKGDKNMTFLQMLSEGPAVLGDVLTAIGKLQGDLPLLLKTIADFQALSADEKDPVKLMADLNAILPDVTADLQAISALFPQPTVVTPAAPTPPAA